MNPLILHRLAKQINEREQTIAQLRDLTVQNCNAAIAEAIQQGKDLMEVKGSLDHGRWLDWLRIHCPQTKPRMAQRYILLATKAATIPQLNEAGSLRLALSLCEEEGSSGEQSETRSLPAYLEAISKASKFLGYVSQHPLTDWPSEGLDKLRQDMQPLAAQLWPDRFE